MSLPAIPLRDHLLTVITSYKDAKREPFMGHPVGTLINQTIPKDLQRLPFISKGYKVQGSVGMCDWSNIPYIAIMDKRITESTQNGEYICYLFSENMDAVYLTIQLWLTEPLSEKVRKDGHEYSQIKELRSLLSEQPRYDLEKMPDNEVLIKDLGRMTENYKLYVDKVLAKEEPMQDTPVVDDMSEDVACEISLSPKARIEEIKLFIQNKGFNYPAELIENFYLSLKTKPFVILAGISGTGKTKLVKLFAEAIGATGKNGQFMLVPVRSDWTDPTELLGYTDLAGNFRPGRFSKLLALATRPENRDKPFFVCLDEMNLARVEHYFSDLLSIMETRHWEEDRIVTDPVLSQNDQDELFQDEYHNLAFPDNVYVVGTVNMDETTYPFSKKVLDRAQTMEFSYVDLAKFPERRSKEEINQQTERMISSPSSNSFFRSDYITLKDAYPENEELIRRSTGRLVEVNRILEPIHSQVGFRVRDEIIFYLLYNNSYGLMDEHQAFDLQLLQKILPRLQGSSSFVKSALIQLMLFALGEDDNLAELLEDETDIYLLWQESDVITKAKFPETARKLAYMLRRLEEDGFTSFWLT